VFKELITVKKKIYKLGLYSSPNIIRQIKSRRMRWVGHVTRMGEERKVYREGKRPLASPRCEWEDGIRMVLGEVWSGSNWLRIGAGGGSCEYGDEPAGSGATDLVSYIPIKGYKIFVKKPSCAGGMFPLL
jgi:hypothetical protein